MIRSDGRVFQKMSNSWFLVLFTLFLAVYITGVEPSKRSKHRGHRGTGSSDRGVDIPNSQGLDSDGRAALHANESRIRVPTQDPVTYDGDQVFRVFVENAKGRKRVNDLVNKGGKNLNHIFLLTIWMTENNIS